MVSTGARVLVAGSVLAIGAVLTVIFLTKRTKNKKGNGEQKNEKEETVPKRTVEDFKEKKSDKFPEIKGKRKHPNDDFTNCDIESPKKPHEMTDDNFPENRLSGTFDMFRKEIEFVKEGVLKIVGSKNTMKSGTPSESDITDNEEDQHHRESVDLQLRVGKNGTERKVSEGYITFEASQNSSSKTTQSHDSTPNNGEPAVPVIQNGSHKIVNGDKIIEKHTVVGTNEIVNGEEMIEKQAIPKTEQSIKETKKQDDSYKRFNEDEIKDALLVSQTSPGLLSGPNAEVLSSLINHPDPKLQEAALNGINRCSTFTRNQNLFREHGCLSQLSNLLYEQRMSKTANPKIVTSVANAITNLSSNEENHRQLENCVSTLVDLTLEDETGESVCLSSLKALTNLSITSQHHGHYTRVVQRLYDLVETGPDSIKLQAAKVLVNLSCNADLVPHMLAARAPSCLIELLKQATDEEILLRWTTLLANILTTAKEQKMTSASLPADDKAPSPETMYTALFGVNSGQLKSKVYLLTRHKNENICHQASKIYQVMTKI